MRLNEMTGHNFNAPQVGELLEILNKDCSKWIHETKWIPVYRGSKMVNPYEDFVKIKTRPEKQDPDIPPAIQKSLDWALEQKGHKALIKNSIHVTGNYQEASTYGRVFVVFPIGNFDFTWSPAVLDLMGILSKDDKELTKLKSVIPTYQHTGLKQGIRAGMEILVRCEYYYKLDVELWKEISA